MQPLDLVESTGVPMPAADINTDQIVPARFMHKPRENYGNYCFHDLRFDATGQRRPEFVLNQPASQGAQFLVAGPNFGCGSSREHAVFTLADHGFRVIVAPSFGDIFFINCFKNGVLPVAAPPDFVAHLLQRLADQPASRLRVRLSEQTLTAPDGASYRFDIDAFRKDCLLRGLDELDVTLALRPRIEAYEAHHSTFSNSPSSD
jgi:3-isopropylmalate/(R)-2-methylmalate dehydratase small subunit